MEQVWGLPSVPLWPTCSWGDETKAIDIAANPLTLCRRYIDDTFVIQKTEHKTQLLQHINSTDPHIQFTTEEPNTDRPIPFLETPITPGPNNTLLTTTYRKSMHTDHYSS